MCTTFIHAKIQISVGQLLKLCQPLIQYIMVQGSRGDSVKNQIFDLNNHVTSIFLKK
jgi:hypothetical protein